MASIHYRQSLFARLAKELEKLLAIHGFAIGDTFQHDKIQFC